MNAKNKDRPSTKITNVYITALIITIIVFILGLLLGLSVERYILSGITKKTSSIENSIQEIELELLYFQWLNSTDSCDFLREIARKTNNKLDSLADQLSGYSTKNILFTKNDVKNIKSKYTSLLIKDWLLQEKIKKDCDANVVSVIYFYSTEGCYDCITQGEVLTLLKNKFKDKLMVFPLDVGLKSDMVNILMSRFNVTLTPTVVVNNNKYDGIISKTQLESIICSELPEIAECS